MKIISTNEMRELDKQTIEIANISAKKLMFRAGIGAAEYILDFIKSYHSNHKKRFVLLAGKGNNGGDAFVIAQYLYEKTDIPVVIFAICATENLKDNAKYYANNLSKNIPYKVCDKIDLLKGDIIIDGLLGTGIKGKLKPPINTWVDTVNKKQLPVIALDIPSGLDGDTGFPIDSALIADLTISMGLPKYGYFTDAGSKYCGTLRNVDIGIPQNFIDDVKSDLTAIYDCDVCNEITRISNKSHKYNRGSVTVIGGSELYQGAPFLSAKAALRSGAGIVSLFVPKSISKESNIDALIVRKVERFSETLSSLDKQNAIVVGPGMGKESDSVDFLTKLAQLAKPIIFDADALNIISENPHILKTRKCSSILTPHSGEFERLLKAFKIKKDDRISQAKELATATNSIIVLKGHCSLIVTPNCEVCINTTGSPALATAGSGDVLAGMIGGYLAQGNSPLAAIKIAVFIHGLISEQSQFGVRGLIADDIIDDIPKIAKKLSPFA